MAGTKQKPKPAPKIRDVRLCSDERGNEAIYIDGRLIDWQYTFYISEVAEHCGRKPVKLRHHSVELHDRDWPKRFGDLTLLD